MRQKKLLLRKHLLMKSTLEKNCVTYLKLEMLTETEELYWIFFDLKDVVIFVSTEKRERHSSLCELNWLHSSFIHFLSQDFPIKWELNSRDKLNFVDAKRFTDLDKLNLVKLDYSGLVLVWANFLIRPQLPQKWR